MDEAKLLRAREVATDQNKVPELAAGAVNALQWHEIYAAARRRTMRDACMEGYDFHLAREIAERLATTIAEEARADERERWTEVLRPFVDLGPQRGAWGVISKKLDGMAPLTVTVTKAQMLAACTAIRNQTTTGNNEERV